MAETPKLDFRNTVKTDNPFPFPTIQPDPVEITIANPIKVFGYKWGFNEVDCCQGIPDKGDDLGFTLIFGNYGEHAYPGDPITPMPTAQDTFIVPCGVRLKVMSICSCGYKIYNGVISPSTQIQVGDIFTAGIYTIIITDENDNPYFPLLIHSVHCVSMLFQIEAIGEYEPQLLEPPQTELPSAQQYGIVRLRNFGRNSFDPQTGLPTGAEVYLSSSIGNMDPPTTSRQEQDLIWDKTNTVKFRYEASTGKVYVKIGSNTEIVYTAIVYANSDIDTVQFKVVNRSGASVELKNTTVNGISIGEDLVGPSGCSPQFNCSTWTLKCINKSPNGDVIVETTLELGDNQSKSNELNKVEIILGKA